MFTIFYALIATFVIALAIYVSVWSFLHEEDEKTYLKDIPITSNQCLIYQNFLL